MASDAINPSSDATNGSSSSTNGDHATAIGNGATASPAFGNTANEGDGAGHGADTGAQGPDAGTLFYQLSSVTLLAATWAALVREDRNAEADRVESMGRATYGSELFQSEMNRAVENA